jgi:hypothetical protein
MKEILVDNKKKFYSKLFLYKTFLYKRVMFKSSLDDEELQGIITALNIKKKSKRIEYIYDYSCNRIDKFYKGKNMCQFKDGQCINHQYPGCNIKNGCCRICINQSETGCKTSNLSCKLFYCDNVKKNNETIKFKDMKIFKLLTFRQRIIILDNFFANREEFLKELKLGLLVYHSLMIVYRLMRSSIILRKRRTS